MADARPYALYDSSRGLLLLQVEVFHAEGTLARCRLLDGDPRGLVRVSVHGVTPIGPLAELYDVPAEKLLIQLPTEEAAREARDILDALKAVHQAEIDAVRRRCQLQFASYVAKIDRGEPLPIIHAARFEIETGDLDEEAIVALLRDVGSGIIPLTPADVRVALDERHVGGEAG